MDGSRKCMLSLLMKGTYSAEGVFNLEREVGNRKLKWKL